MESSRSRMVFIPAFPGDSDSGPIADVRENTNPFPRSHRAASCFRFIYPFSFVLRPSAASVASWRHARVSISRYPDISLCVRCTPAHRQVAASLPKPKETPMIRGRSTASRKIPRNRGDSRLPNE